MEFSSPGDRGQHRCRVGQEHCDVGESMWSSIDTSGTGGGHGQPTRVGSGDGNLSRVVFFLLGDDG